MVEKYCTSLENIWSFILCIKEDDVSLFRNRKYEPLYWSEITRNDYDFWCSFYEYMGKHGKFNSKTKKKALSLLKSYILHDSKIV